MKLPKSTSSHDITWGADGNTSAKLKLDIFKDLYSTCKTSNPVINFLIFSFLYWLEERYIDYKTKVAIDEAEREYHREMDAVEQDWKEAAVITETKSPTSELLPEMRIQAPWTVDDKLE